MKISQYLMLVILAVAPYIAHAGDTDHAYQEGFQDGREAQLEDMKAHPELANADHAIITPTGVLAPSQEKKEAAQNQKQLDKLTQDLSGKPQPVADNHPLEAPLPSDGSDQAPVNPAPVAKAAPAPTVQAQAPTVQDEDDNDDGDEDEVASDDAPPYIATPQASPQQQRAQALVQTPQEQYRQPQQVAVQQPPAQIQQTIQIIQPNPGYYEPAEQYGRAPSYRNEDQYSQASYQMAQPYQQVVPIPTYQQAYVPPPVYQPQVMVMPASVAIGIRAAGYVPRNGVVIQGGYRGSVYAIRRR